MGTMCCEAFAEQAGELVSSMGPGLYPESEYPNAQFEKEEDGWAINGCCGGGCYIITKMVYCPFCGKKVFDGHA